VSQQISENPKTVVERAPRVDRHSSRNRLNSSGESNRIRQNGQSGQIIVEYVLLLAIAVIVAALITRAIISPDPNSPGFMLKSWDEIVKAIGADHADDIERGQ
jgi:hypothetical protein